MKPESARRFPHLLAAMALYALAGQLPFSGLLVAQSATVIIPATAAIWLAGQPPGAERFGDVVPNNAPVAVELLGFDPALPLVFRVEGRTSRSPDGIPLVDADGEAEGSSEYASWDVPPWFSLNGLVCSFSALVGVFLDVHTVAPVLPNLRFVDDSEKAFTDLSPALQQVFFIGDGRTGEGTGLEQHFAIPVGADILYLGLFDAENNNNVGQLAVTVDSAPPPSLKAALAGDGRMALTWPGRPGITLQKKVRLTDHDWQDVTGSDGLSSMELPMTDSTAFFRLVKP